MPIAFPPSRVDSILINYPLRARFMASLATAPNLGRPGIPFTVSTLNGGAWPMAAVNVQKLGVMYQAPTDTAIVNPVNTVRTDRLLYDRKLSDARWQFTGVSRDSTGAILATCQVLIYRTNDRGLETETVSDGNGDWSVLVSQAREHFFVEYKAGAPDVFGTSPNTRTPVQV